MSTTTPARSLLPHRLASPRDWSLRLKLSVALLVPAILALVLSGLRIADQAAQAADFDRVARFATAQGDVETLLRKLQVERLRSAEFVASGRLSDPHSLDQVFADVDASSVAIGPEISALHDDDPGIIGADQQAQQGLARVAAVRALVTGSNAPSSTVLSRYTDLTDLVTQLDDRLLRDINTPTTAGLATALSGLAVARNEASLQTAIINAAARDSTPVSLALADLPASDARLMSGLADFRAALDVGQRVRYAGLISGEANTARITLVAGLRSQDPGRTIAPDVAAGTGQAYDSFLGEIDTAITGVRTELTDNAAASRSAATAGVWVNIVLLLLAALVGAAIVFLIARQLISSLRTLRRSALDVAWTRLPESVRRMRSGAVPDVDVQPVPIDTHEEIGEVARAFDIVHTEAVRLAAEQATLQNNVNRMFINLSRRSKSLVDRQLQLIEGLESNEQDADQLSALFRLDHLATRMRRNSENLLVLAGTDLGNRSSKQVPVVDVLRAAVGEIERYERIVVEQPPPVLVAGRAASDIQHLVAELLDNATSFSPPDSKVVMTAHHSRDGSVVVDIVDRGVGMRSDELAEANAQLSRTNVASADTGRRMGLLVVGRLASRHEIQVELSCPPGRPGVTARATIPAGLISIPKVPGQARRTPLAPAPSPMEVPQATAPVAVVPEQERPVAPVIPLQPTAGRDVPELPKRIPAQPIGEPAAMSDAGSLFTAFDAPAPDSPPFGTDAVPRPAEQPRFPSRPVARERDPLTALRTPSNPVQVNSGFFTDNESGQQRFYRPVQVNWLPDPATGRTPDDESVQEHTSPS